MQLSKRSFPGLLVMVMSLVGCGTARPIVPVPQSLAEATTAMQVKRSRQAFGAVKFGEWKVTHFDKKGFPGQRTSRWGVDRISLSKTKAHAAYSFVMTSTEGGDEWQCRCEENRRRRDLGVGPMSTELTYEESFECDLLRDGDVEPWKLEVNGSLAINGRGFAGTLTHGSRSLAIEPLHEITGLGRVAGVPLGYLVVREGQEIASAETILPGFVRISDDAGEDRDAIATAVAALLMQPRL